MPRKPKDRLVGIDPEFVRFRAEGISLRGEVVMTLDEFETIRLLDLEKLTQEEAACRMEVSRPTVTAIYDRAREKLADVLVNGKQLSIGGGAAILQQNFPQKIKTKKRKGASQMRIAVTYDKNTQEIWQHFGRTEFFKVYDIEDNKIVKSEIVSTNGQGHGALGGVLKDLETDILICGGIGGGAQNVLAKTGIKLYGGCSGSADKAVEDLLAKKLVYNPNVHCDHHGHGEGHHEGHGNGEHHCHCGSH